MSTSHSNGNGRGIPAASYIRMSSDKQDASPQQQRDEVAKLAARTGHTLVAEYADEAVSGDRTDKRHGFQKMIRDASAGKFQAILCWDQDRFGRFDSVEAGFWIHPLRQAGVKLVTVAQGVVDWSDFAGRLIYSVQQEGKHASLRDLSRNALRGRIAAARRGEWLNKPPLGYRIQNKRLVPDDPQDVATVRRIFQQYHAGYSLRAIAIELNADGVRTRSGKPWVGQTVKEILTNQAYVGRFVWGNEQSGKYHTFRHGEVSTDTRHGRDGDAFVFQNWHPAIIDQDRFDAVQRRLAERRTATTPHPGGGGFVFTGLCRCGKCGSPMYGRKVASSARYNCEGHQRRQTCDLNATGQAELLDAVLTHVERHFQNPTVVKRLRSAMTDHVTRRTKRVDLEGLRRRLTKVDSQLGTARRNMALADGDDLRRDYEAVVRELRSERDQLAASIQAAQKPLGRDAGDLNQRITTLVDKLCTLRATALAAPPVKQRELLARLVEKVEVWSTRDHAKAPYRLERGVVHLRPDMWLAVSDNLSGFTC